VVEGKRPKDAKAERLAAALRANLKRRKAQAKAQTDIKPEPVQPPSRIVAKNGDRDR
jgi:hypothetical protein